MQVKIDLEDTKLFPDSKEAFVVGLKEYIGNWVHKNQYGDVVVEVTSGLPD
jgi:hypothetical protein